MIYLSVLKQTEDKTSYDQLLYIKLKTVKEILDVMLTIMCYKPSDKTQEITLSILTFLKVMMKMSNQEDLIDDEDTRFEIFIDWLEEAQQKEVIKAIHILNTDIETVLEELNQ